MRPQARKLGSGRNNDGLPIEDPIIAAQDQPAPMTEGRSMKRSASLKNFLHSKDPSRSPIKSTSKSTTKNLEEKPLKKSKSSTSLSALFSRPRSSKGAKAEEMRLQDDKENEAPSESTNLAQPPPIWAQFATTALLDSPGTRQIPLNDCNIQREEIEAKPGGRASPSKGRASRDKSLPRGSGKSEPKPRPKSDCLEPVVLLKGSREVASELRRSARHREGAQASKQLPAYHQRETSNEQKHIIEEKKHDFLINKRGSRVLEAAEFFNQKAQQTPNESMGRPASAQLDPIAVDNAFEALLDTRNVPLATRDKMRRLDTNIKADFVKQDKAGPNSASSTEGLVKNTSRPTSRKHEQTEDDIYGQIDEQKDTCTPKKSRPRSLTFTFSKGDQSPSKRQKSSSHQRAKSGEVVVSAPSKPSSPAVNSHGLSLFSKSDKFALPEQVIGYLRKVQQPQAVEVGKIQKLRQLLRNETVGWVDEFISQGGMIEIIQLMYRTLEIEWREEHEDVLLHENLLCLKALTTTSSAMFQFSEIQGTLFPTLLKTLFDEERKGPSEYHTRTIIFNLLHSYLIDSTTDTIASRARTLLSYLQDQVPRKIEQAPAFITSIYHPRPYRTWHKELNNLTKEVFWIFLHHHNIIPYPPNPSDPTLSYQERHFPKEHPPVAAAPYIGGVEWDATTYVTAHLDLINGLIASLPTQVERNKLRHEMRDSGFEKLMGVSLRTCKEKFYGSVHQALSVWCGAALEDGWPDKDVRQGPPKEEVVKSPVKKSKKKDQAPKLDMPKLDLGAEMVAGTAAVGDWL